MLSRIRIIDYAVLLCVLAAVIGTMLLFSRKQITVYVDIIPIPQEGNANPFPPQFTQVGELNVGDASYNGLGKKTAEITNVVKTDWQGNRKSVRVTVKMQVALDPRTHQYTYTDIPILAGSKFTLTTDKATLDGLIIGVYTSDADRQKHVAVKSADVVINVRWLEEWQAESLRNFIQTDSNGTVLVRTTDIAITPAEIDVQTDRGVIYKGYSTQYKNVRLTLKVNNILCSDETCYINGLVPLKIGAVFSAQSHNAFIDAGSIVDFTLNP